MIRHKSLYYNRVPLLFGIIGIAIVLHSCDSVKVHQPLSSAETVTCPDPNQLLNEAVAFYEGIGVEQDIDRAITLLQRAADLGEPEAMCRLGFIFEEGIGVQPNPDLAMNLWEQAAKKGHRLSMYCLAEQYDKARFIPRDFDKAVYWYTESIKSGDNHAVRFLCRLLESPPNSCDKARYFDDILTWNLYAAKRGDVDAMVNLGDIYGGTYFYGDMCLKGISTKKDLKQAIQWYEQAAQYGNLDAMNGLIYLYENEKDVQNEAKVIKWLERASEHNDIFAMYDLAEKYKNGEGVQQDYQKAISLYAEAARLDKGGTFHGNFSELKELCDDGYLASEEYLTILLDCAERGNSSAMETLGSIYANGDIVQRNDDKALKWWSEAAYRNPFALINFDGFYSNDPNKIIPYMEKAAAGGHTYIMMELGKLYEKKPNLGGRSLAFKWYREAAYWGDKDGMVGLARLYARGDGVKRDYQKAFHWYLRASRDEYFEAQAMRELSEFYAKGLGVPVNSELAKQWLEKADERERRKIYYKKEEAITEANNGDMYAMYELGESYEYGWRDTQKDLSNALIWYVKSAEKVYQKAMWKLADSYLLGLDLTGEDMSKAAYWYEKLADSGDVDAMLILAEIYEGRGNVPSNNTTCEGWYSRAIGILVRESGEGFPDAMGKLAELYLAGKGLEMDYQQAHRLLCRAFEEKKDYEIACPLAKLYVEGRGVEQDFEKALAIFEEAYLTVSEEYITDYEKVDKYVINRLDYYFEQAHIGSSQMMYNLGTLYWNGIGVEKDQNRAKDWFSKASRLGNIRARNVLKNLKAG